MKKIKNINVDQSTMPSTETTRSLAINADVDSEFIIIIIENDTIKYYDFESQSFELGHNNINNNLSVKTKKVNEFFDIVFPSGGGTYTIKIIAGFDTETNESFSKKLISREISKIAANPIVTFTPVTANTNNYATFPTNTSQGSISDTDSFDFNWAITNASSDSHGFGLRVTGGSLGVGDSFWYITTTDTVDGATASSVEVKVDDITNIGVGSIITGVSSGSLSGTPSVSKITGNLLTLSSAQTFADGITLTFKAYGSVNIFKATGAKFNLGTSVVKENALSKSIRAGSSGTTINLNGTYGIAGGNHVILKGLGIDNSSANAVTSVSASSSAGSIVVQNSQSGLTTGAVIAFSGSNQVVDISGNILVETYPLADLSVNLDLDQLITVGAAS